MTRYVLCTRYVAFRQRDLYHIEFWAKRKTYRFCDNKNIEQSKIAYRLNILLHLLWTWNPKQKSSFVRTGIFTYYLFTLHYSLNIYRIRILKVIGNSEKGISECCFAFAKLLKIFSCNLFFYVLYCICDINLNIWLISYKCVFFYLLVKMHALFSHTCMRCRDLCRNKRSCAFFSA